MSNATLSKTDWVAEADYCLDVLANWDMHSAQFDGEWDCFASYCDMQAVQALKAGMTDIWDIITAVRNAAHRKSKSNAQRNTQRVGK